VPYPGYRWSIAGEPARYPHEYVKGKPAKLLTLLNPKTGRAIAKGVKRSSNAVLHPWLQETLEEIVENLPNPNQEETQEARRKSWRKWQEGIKTPFTLLEELPALKMVLILDNLAGHKTPSFVVWLMEHGIMPLYTPIAGSWLNMTESLQSIIKRRALGGQHPKTAEETICRLEEATESWNRNPTPFIWGGKRANRRERRREKYKRLQGSGASVKEEGIGKINRYVRGK